MLYYTLRCRIPIIKSKETKYNLVVAGVGLYIMTMCYFFVGQQFFFYLKAVGHFSITICNIVFQKKTYLSNTVVAIRKRSHLLNCSRDVSALDNFSGYYSTSIYSFAQLQMKNKYISYYLGDKQMAFWCFLTEDLICQKILTKTIQMAWDKPPQPIQTFF